MSFNPSNPIASSTWTAATSTSISTWSADSEATVFDVLADIDGTIITALDGTTINLFGGFKTDTPSVVGTWSADSITSSTWTVEG